MTYRPPEDSGPRLLPDWDDRRERSLALGSGLASILLHASAVAIAFLLPSGFWQAVTPPQLSEVRRLIPLIAPPFELTQKEPNRGKITKEIDYDSLRARPRLSIPPAPESTPGSGLRRPSVEIPKVEAPKPAPLPEPPKIDVAVNRPPPALGQEIAAPPPPQIQTTEKPKLAFETPAAMAGSASGAPRGVGRVAPPVTSVDEAVRSAARQSRAGGIVVGDLGEGPGGIGEAINLPGLPGRQGSSLELLSDPLGIDFRPYLTRILAAVRRNWFAVMPESARLGRPGRVQIQFAIARDGHVPKLVIASPSGADALDRAAVAGISASNPFPPLPSGFRGEQIRLQFTFLYNLPRR